MRISRKRKKQIKKFLKRYGLGQLQFGKHFTKKPPMRTLTALRVMNPHGLECDCIRRTPT